MKQISLKTRRHIHAIKWATLLVCTLLTPYRTSALGTTTKSEIASLKHLSSVCVVVETLRQGHIEFQLSEDSIHHLVEDNLQAAGVKIEPVHKLRKKSNLLAVTVALMCPQTEKDSFQTDFYIYTVELAIRQNARLTRDRGISLHAITWMVSLTGAVKSGDPTESIRNCILVCVDKFLKDYRQAND